MSSGPPSKKAKTSNLLAEVKPWETLGCCFKIDFEKPQFVSMGPMIFDLDGDDLHMVARPQAKNEITTVSSTEETSDKFSTAVSISASFGCFGGSASMGIDKSSKQTYHTSRTDVTNTCIKYKVSPSTGLMLRPESFLNAEVEAAIREGDISMQELEKIIGTFYCREYHLGGYFERSYIVETSSKESASSVEASLKANFGGALVQASAGFSLGKQKSKSNKNAKMCIKENIVGGDTEIWLGSSGKAGNSEELLKNWAASVNDTNLHPLGMQLEFTWKLVEAINPSMGEDYKAYMKANWKEQEIKGTPTKFVKEEKPPPHFYLKNGNGHYLAVPGNNFNKDLCVWSKTSEAGQLWIWEDVKQSGYGKIKSKLGDKYVSVSRNSGSRGAEILTFAANPAKEEAGQQWRLKNGYLMNEKGLALAVNGNGGRGSHLCQWSAKNQGGQRWEQIDHVE